MADQDIERVVDSYACRPEPIDVDKILASLPDDVDPGEDPWGGASFACCGGPGFRCVCEVADE